MTTNRDRYHHGDLKNALIQAGIEILATEGVHALSLRRVARAAGVSPAAPYAHFANKQALIAAISTAGHQKLYDRLKTVVTQYAGNPARQLVEAGWTYMDFALTDTAHFRITMSGIVEQEKAYPALVAATQESFRLVMQIVSACQERGILKQGPTDLLALSIWSAIHGLVSLILESQVSHTVLERFSLREILVFTLNQFALVPLDRD
jgi:AcrR family transcriptional regulator